MNEEEILNRIFALESPIPPNSNEIPTYLNLSRNESSSKSTKQNIISINVKESNSNNNITVNFDPEALKRIILVKHDKKSDIKIISYIILHASLQWYNIFKENHDTEHFILVLDSLNYALYGYPNISRDCFAFILESVSIHCTSYPPSQLFATIDQYFIFQSRVDPNFQDQRVQNVITQWILKLKANFNNESELLLYVSQVITEYPFAFSPINAQKLLNSINDKLMLLDIGAFTFFSKIVTLISPKVSESIILTIPAFLVSFIENYDILIDISNRNLEITEFQTNNIFSSYSLLFIDTRKNIPEAFLKPLYTIEEMSLDPIDNQELIVRLNLIISIMTTQNYLFENPFNIFGTMFHDNENSKYCYTILFSFLKICDSLRNLNPTVSNFVLQVFNSQVFDPHDSLFKDADLRIIQLRKLAFRVLLNCPTPLLEVVFESKQQYPLLISEFFFMLSHSNLVCLQTGAFPSIVVKMSLFYSGNHTEEAENMRNEMFQFIEKAFSIEQIAELFFKNDQFISIFFSFVFDLSWEPTILRLSKKVFMDFELNPDSEFRLFVIEIFTSLMNRIDEERSLPLLCEILEMLTDILANKPHQSSEFVKLCEPISDCLTKIESTDESRRFFLISLKFYGLSSNATSLTSKVKDSIYIAIKKLEGDEPSDECFINLMQIIAGTKIEDIRPSFLIKQPKILPLFIDAYSRSTRIIGYLNFLKQLCEFSITNCISSHEGQLDLSLLKLIDEHKLDNHQLVKTAYDLFVIIASVASSNPAVSKFISLFCPYNGQYQSPVLFIGLEALNTIMSSKNTCPNAFIPLSKEVPPIIIEELPELLFTKGFTVTMWLFVDEGSTDQTTLGSIFSNDETGVVFLLHNYFLCLQICTPKETQSVKYEIPIPTGCWTFIAISFQVKDKETLLSRAFIDNKSITIPNMKWYKTKGNVVCKFGGKQISDNHPPLLGPFGLFNMLNSTDCFAFTNPSFCPNLEKYFFVNTIVVNSIVRLRAKTDYHIIFNHEIIQNMSFADVLLNFFKINILIPLFVQIELPSLDNLESKPLLPLVLNIFSSLMLTNNQVFEDFLKINGFAIIAFLLSNSGGKLTYSLFKQVQAVYKQLPNSPIKQQMFKHLIFNPILWHNVPQNDLCFITKQWFDEFPKDFSNTMAIFQYIFWRNDEYSEDIRQNLIEILFVIATSGNFTNEDFHNLILQTIESPHPDFFILIQKLAMTNDSPLMKYSKYFHQFLLLQRVLESRNVDIIYELFKTIVILYRVGIFVKPNLSAHLDALSPFIPKSIMNITFLKKVMDLIELKPEFIKIAVTIISQSEGNECAEFLMTNLVPGPKFYINQAWSFFPTKSCLGKNESYLSFMMNFILESSVGYWSSTYCIITIVSVAQCAINGAACRYFLIHMGNKIMSSFNKELFDQFIELSHFYMFTKPVNLMLEHILNVPQYESPKSFSEKIKEISTEFLNQKEIMILKGLKIDENGMWMDYQLAFLIIKLVSKYHQEQLYDYAMFLASFITRCAKPTVVSQVSEYFIVNDVNSTVTKFYLHDPSVDPNQLFEQIDTNLFQMSDTKILTQIVRMAGYIVKYHKKTKIRQHLFLEKMEIKNLRKTPLSSVQNHLETLNEERKQNWKQLWTQFTYDQAPWHKSLNINEIPRWKRDKRLCSNLMIPTLLKKNINFDDHRDASFCRDSGSVVTAQQMLEDYRKQMKEGRIVPPTLLEVDQSIENLQSKEVQAESNEMIMEKQAQYVTIANEGMSCAFILYSTMIQLKFNESTIKIIQKSDVAHIMLRTYLHRPTAIEIYTVNGRSYYIHFKEIDCLSLLKKISWYHSWKDVQIQTFPSPKYFAMKSFTQRWAKGRISNFKYLLLLNQYSGRTFSNASSYPVIPWIISDYFSDSLNLDDQSSYRDLTKPIGAFGEKRMTDILSRQKDMETYGNQSFLYSAYGVSPLSLYLWMMRMEPFTSLHIKLQSGKFDHAARLFSSIGDSYRMVTSHLNDFRELIPEFFFLPDFLENQNDFDLGIANDKKLGDVELPPWAENSMDFIYKNRKALESKYVSENLNNWIDLVWGYKQRGNYAKEAMNTYDPNMYDDVWTDENLKNPQKSLIIEATQMHCGQVPQQMFTEPHPQKRAMISDIKIDENTFEIGSEILFSKIIVDNGVYVIAYYDKAGNIGKFTIEQNTRMTKNETIIHIDPSIAVSCSLKSSNNFLIGTTVGYLFDIDLKTGEKKKYYGHIGCVNSISVCGSKIATCGNDTSTIEFDSETKRTILNVPSYASEIEKCYLSTSYHTIVSAARDGTILIISEPDGTILRTLKTEMKPRLVLVTQEWGFIVLYLTKLIEGKIHHYIKVYSINGREIRTKEINFMISCWTSYVSYDGFDYIILGSENGQLYAFEAYYLNITESLARCQSHINSILYYKEKNLIIAVTSNGLVRYISGQKMCLTC